MKPLMGINKKYKNAVDLEKLLIDCVGKADAIDEKYSKLLEIVQDMEKNMQFCCQKVGIVRYNPFEEMGGNLCFAIAILDAENTGVVINGTCIAEQVHSPMQSLLSLVLAHIYCQKEEQEAIDKAKNSAYQAVKNTVTAKKPSKMLKAKKRKEKEEEIKKQG